MKNYLFTKITCIVVLVIMAPICCYVLYHSLGNLRENQDQIFVQDDIFLNARAGIDYLNAQYNENIPLKMKFIEANGFFQNAFNRHYIEDVAIENSIVKDNYGQLHFTGFWQEENVFDQKTLPGLIKQITTLNQALKEKNLPLLYIAAPEKIIAGSTQFPILINNYANAKVDSFLKALQDTEIPTLDLRQVITEPAANKADLFYKTDHHWQSQTAFDAAFVIADYINNNFGTNIDSANYYRDINNYAVEDYPAFFVGSQGRRVGKYYAGVDDFHLIYPKFATDYTVTYFSGREKSRTGDYRSALIFDDFLKDDNIYTNRYAAYLGGDHPLMTITNHKQDKYKILIIKDSFTAPAASFLSTAVHEIKLVDLRHYNDSLTDLALAYQPDLTIILYSAGGLNDTMFSFDKQANTR
ncbi:MAG: alginate O-acetyltransferase AlgX-related protein [Bacillota bacterium]|jgi:hypothetical protein